MLAVKPILSRLWMAYMNKRSVLSCIMSLSCCMHALLGWTAVWVRRSRESSMMPAMTCVVESRLWLVSNEPANKHWLWLLYLRYVFVLPALLCNFHCLTECGKKLTPCQIKLDWLQQLLLSYGIFLHDHLAKNCITLPILKSIKFYLALWHMNVDGDVEYILTLYVKIPSRFWKICK